MIIDVSPGFDTLFEVHVDSSKGEVYTLFKKRRSNNLTYRDTLSNSGDVRSSFWMLTSIHLGGYICVAAHLWISSDKSNK